MQSLANRHEDRARRKALNRTFGVGGPVMGVGTAALAYRNYADLRARLGNNEALLEELDAAIEGIDAEFAGGRRSLAEAPDGSGDTMAGIGVVNTKVVPAATIARSDAGKGASVSNDAAWGDTAPVTVEALPEAEPINGNPNGAALVDQLGSPDGGWGTPGTPSTADLKANGGGTGGNAGNGGGGEGDNES